MKSRFALSLQERDGGSQGCGCDYVDELAARGNARAFAQSSGSAAFLKKKTSGGASHDVGCGCGYDVVEKMMKKKLAAFFSR